MLISAGMNEYFKYSTSSLYIVYNFALGLPKLAYIITSVAKTKIKFAIPINNGIFKFVIFFI